MRFTVVSIPSAQNDLAEIWNQAPNRKEVTEAANRIDRALQIDAQNRGIEFEGERALAGILHR